MTRPHTNQRTTEKGSAFVFILIGIALFAALSYTVTQSMRISSDNEGLALGSREKANALIADVMQYMEVVKMRVFTLTATENIPEALLDFRTDFYELPAGGSVTGNFNATCSDASCRIFSDYSPNGVVPMIFKDIAASTQQTSALYPLNGHGRVGTIDIKGVGSAAPDLVFVIYGVKPQICNLYNQKQGITTNYDASTTATSIGESGANATPDTFAGSFTTTRSFGYSATEFAGKKSFCAPAASDATIPRLGIWHVVKAR